MTKEADAKTMQNELLLRELADSVSEITRILKVTSYPGVKRALKSALDSDEKKLVYDLSDGTRTSDEIVKELRKWGFSKGASTIRTWLNDWEKSGLISANGKSKKKFFSLRDYGLEVRNTSNEILQPTNSDSEGSDGSKKQEEHNDERGNPGANNENTVESGINR